MEIISRRPSCLNSCCCYCGANVTNPVAAGEVNPVTRKNFDVLSVLGAGAFGKVFLVRKKDGADSGHLYAMKELLKAKIIKNKKITECTIMERQVLEAVRHSPFIIGLNYAFQTDDKLHLILDYVCGGDLHTHFCLRQRLPEEEVRFYVGEVVLALEQLHKIGVIYRDLKPENLLIDAQGHIVLTDFGLCKKFSPFETPRTYSHCGTLEYMAPEVIRGPSGHDMAADWWSTGILTCELLAGDRPFSVVGKRKYQERLRRRILTAKPRIPNDISPEASDFILKLLESDPQKRLGGGEGDAEELKRHPFFRELDWSALGQKRISAPFIPILSDKMDATHISEEPAAPSKSRRTAPLSSDNTFRGYSFVRPSMLSENVMSCQLTGDSFLNSENTLSCKFGVSLFFENYELDLKDGMLGGGGFSVCHKCTNRQTGKEFAVKIMTHKIDCTQEINLLHMCQGHPNIVSLHEVYYDEAHTYIVLELLCGGELLDRIRKGRFTETEASQVMRKLISALNFMHSCGVVHRDLKPENILFTDDSEQADIKIVDFGLAGLKQENQTMHTPCCTLQYAAPEVLKEAFTHDTDGYDENCDLWSLGVILYTMLCGHTPYQVESGDDVAVVMARINGEEFSSNIDALDHISSEAKYVTKGKKSDKYVKIESRQEKQDFFTSKILLLDNKFIFS
ncbi:Ribosomal protein S6 kinase alpha-5 [Cryptotermes secundus]|uniref:non-specific serine/threonine protein kinase n=1 Tax=Cryptotermes secundus TaxID=105785 RepID=A0A2J7RSM4_9NEOP|nr:Ribosomal protein S6 kinase alpha-5 [Cryptotermes secundus]